MHRRILASLVALAIGGTHALALAQTSGLDADAPTSSDVRVGEIVSASGLPSTPDAERLERRRVVRDHRGNSSRSRGGVTVRRSSDSDRDGDKRADRSLKDRVKEEIKDRVKDKAKEKIEKEKEKLKERAKKEKDKIEDKIKDKISDWFD